MAGEERNGGFTLLEVMIALAIMAMALVTLSQSHQNSVRAANRARLMTVAVTLARYKMVEVEDDLFEDGFSDFDQEETGDFKDEGFERFSYVQKVDKVELPKSVDSTSLSDTLTGSGGSSSSSTSSSGQGTSAATTAVSMGAKLLSSQYEIIRNILEQAIRRVEVEVWWKEGTRKRSVTVAGYFTDPRKVDSAISGALTSSLTGSATTGSTTTGSTTTGSTTTGSTTSGRSSGSGTSR